MARASTMPAEPPMAWMSLAAIRVSIVGAMAASRLAMKKSERPASSMGRRPNLSEAGP